MGALRRARAVASHSTVKSSLSGSGERVGSTSAGSAVSHSLPNLRPSMNRSSRPSSRWKVWRVRGGGGRWAGCIAKSPVIPKWAIRVAGGWPVRGNSRYLARRLTPAMARPATAAVRASGDGRLTQLGQPMAARVMARPGRLARIRLRRTFSTSGSSGIGCSRGTPSPQPSPRGRGGIGGLKCLCFLG